MNKFVLQSTFIKVCVCIYIYIKTIMNEKYSMEN
jgi:hypothetical protein